MVVNLLAEDGSHSKAQTSPLATGDHLLVKKLLVG
jgi:hypothetical protein